MTTEAQKEFRDQLLKAGLLIDMGVEGLLGRGDDDELRGMARFMDMELKETYPDVYQDLFSAKDTATASNALQKYIKYVPKRPYNSPDREFKVKKNAVWAKKAKAIGLRNSQTTAVIEKSDVSVDTPNSPIGDAPQKGERDQ